MTNNDILAILGFAIAAIVAAVLYGTLVKLKACKSDASMYKDIATKLKNELKDTLPNSVSSNGIKLTNSEIGFLSIIINLHRHNNILAASTIARKLEIYKEGDKHSNIVYH